VPLVKLRQFQDLGHQAVLIIGDFTALIGDPSGRSTTRPVLSRPEIEANARTFAEQVFKILDRQRTEVRHNGEWLSKLSLEDVVRLTAGMTVARMLERDDFRQRYAAGTAIGLHDVFERQLRQPLAVVTHLGPLAVEDLEDLLGKGARVRLDLGPGEDRPGGRTPARVANQGREVADDQHRLVPEVLKLAQLLERHRVPEMNVRGGRIHPELHAQRPAGFETRAQLLLGKDAHHAAPQRRELRRGRHAVTRSRTRLTAVARPVAPSTSISAPCTSTGPEATSKRVGIWVRKRRRTCSIFTPRIEPSGPHMPASVR